ncbi:uncharacterized protein YkwD [Paraburkholderia youngii]|uniref:CAP domain-containing protein n=1 Tax=Paraburkholderia youngii TaxID=2782701 RepID=UPI003D1CAD63
MKKKISALTALSFAAAALGLAACGGGGGGGSSSTGAATSASAPSSASSPTSASSPVTGTQSTPQYAANSAQLAMFNQVNAYRQQCGFPAVQENTVLDQAAQAHAMWEGLNNAVADNETAGQQGFTGVTYFDRAAHFGFPSDAFGGGVSAAYWTAAALSETQYGQTLVNSWLTGVYHAPIVLTPITKMGVGEYETSLNGFPAAWASLTIADTSIQQLTPGAPLTFPCQGVTGVAGTAHTETPTPPNTTGPWGTPVVVMGNATDTLVLTSGTITDPSGKVINLQLLYSANDPNKLLQPYQAVAYPATPLAANTTYTVNVSGTQNGKPFTKPPFTFTTGNSPW